MTVLVKTSEPSTITERFELLARQWKEETALLSSTSAMVNHPAYRAIIALGPAVVPLLLRDMECVHTHWFEALQAITGENPVSPEQGGKIPAMVEGWVAWGRKQGLI